MITALEYKEKICSENWPIQVQEYVSEHLEW